MAGIETKALSLTFNLGQADVFPTISGKKNAGMYVLEKFGVEPAEAAFLCDDENDLLLAAAVGNVFVPQPTAASVAAAAAAAAAAADSSSKVFHIAAVGGSLGTEECLELVLGRCLVQGK